MQSIIASLREAQSDGDVSRLTKRMRLTAAQARGSESAAIHLMSRYGYSDGVDVPELGHLRVVWHDDGFKTLEVLPP